MAKKKSKSKSHSESHRDAIDVSSGLRPLVVIPVSRLSPPSQAVIQLEDRRRFNPTKRIAPPASIRRSHARLTHRQRAKFVAFNRDTIGFNVPEKVAICARREIRKQVLHAKKVAGRSGLKKPRRNFWSSISCKR